jgi:hypothetical protein
MSYSYSKEDVDRISTDVVNDTTHSILGGFFGVSAVRFGRQEIKCRFDAQAPDESKEVRWVAISASNTPEQNMDILRDARRRQAWYEAQRHEVPGIDVPQIKDQDQPEENSTPPAPAKVNS